MKQIKDIESEGKMNKEQIKKQMESLQEHCKDMMKSGGVVWKEDVEALDIVIKALEQEPCEDCISRQAMLKEIRELSEYHTGDAFNKDRVIRALRNLPSVYSAPKKGRWIPVTNGRGGHECSECGKYAPSFQSDREHLTDYCPNCGAKMESEDKND